MSIRFIYSAAPIADIPAIADVILNKTCTQMLFVINRYISVIINLDAVDSITIKKNRYLRRINTYTRGRSIRIEYISIAKNRKPIIERILLTINIRKSQGALIILSSIYLLP